jgi:thermostable 8-oxoguanine DNA glycosylase
MLFNEKLEQVKAKVEQELQTMEANEKNAQRKVIYNDICWCVNDLEEEQENCILNEEQLDLMLQPQENILKSVFETYLHFHQGKQKYVSDTIKDMLVLTY